MNDRRVVSGVPVVQAGAGVAIDGVMVVPPWTVSVIGDPTRLAEVAGLMTQQLHADRRVRDASYRIAGDVVITSTVSQRPFVYAVQS